METISTQGTVFDVSITTESSHMVRLVAAHGNTELMTDLLVEWENFDGTCITHSTWAAFQSFLTIDENHADLAELAARTHLDWSSDTSRDTSAAIEEQQPLEGEFCISEVAVANTPKHYVIWSQSKISSYTDDIEEPETNYERLVRYAKTEEGSLWDTFYVTPEMMANISDAVQNESANCDINYKEIDKEHMDIL